MVLLAYAALAGAYLIVIPALVMVYVERRWMPSGSWEKALMFFLVFFFFPGMLLVGPLLNFRPSLRSL